MVEWRECKAFAVDVDVKEPGSPRRWCHLADRIFGGDAVEVCRETCATCPVAALVEALKEFCNPEGWLGASEPGPWTCLWCDRPSTDGEGHDIKHTAECPVAMGQAALAMLAKGADDADVR